MRRLYDAEGYLNAQIDGPDIRFNTAQTEASITLTIHEGINSGSGRSVGRRFCLLPAAREVAKDTGNIFTDRTAFRCGKKAGGLLP